tara:strand:- start:256 stop:795 length:540 start_codon:yes stop_codon:yes gene_type:complete
MKKNEISIAINTLKLLEKNSWEKISLSNILSKQKNITIKNKTDILIIINRYFDYLLKENLSSLEESSSKDMLFEVLMERLDILNNYRISIKKIINYFLSQPHIFIKVAPSFIESIILIMKLSKINTNGITGVPKIKIVFFLYLMIIYTWNNDQTKSLEKTMTTLDKYLSNLDRLIKLIK